LAGDWLFVFGHNFSGRTGFIRSDLLLSGVTTTIGRRAVLLHWPLMAWACGGQLLIFKDKSVGLSEIDRNLLQRCLEKKPRAWEDFVDRFIGLMVHVVNHTAQARSVRLSAEDKDDLCAEIFLAIIKNDFSVLCSFRGQSSLATYLTVVSRRISVRMLLTRKSVAPLGDGSARQVAEAIADPQPAAEQRLTDREEVGRLLDGLRENEAQVVRMYHLEGKSYQEISSTVGMAENSIGPILSRARDKMRRADVNPATN
jgi:RNA polymerase sigma-70 factor (ECF subfamily)